MKNKRIKFTLAAWSKNKGKVVEVPWQGYTTSTPGLVTCKAPYWVWDRHSVRDGVFEGHWEEVEDEWQVVHLESGRVLPYCKRFSRREDGATVAYMLAGLADWTETQKEIAIKSGQGFDFVEKVGKVVKEFEVHCLGHR